MSREKSHSSRQLAAALAPAAPVPYWLDSASRPPARPGLEGGVACDLAVVGAGFTGLWTALLAKQRRPEESVVVVEAERIAGAATGRNGGFCSASLTHGEANGRQHFPDEFERLQSLGQENLEEIEQFVAAQNIDCGWERSGELAVATEPYQVEELRRAAGEFLDTEQVRAEVASPTYLAGSWDRRSCALVDPARLAWGLAAACESAGVQILEDTPVTDLERAGAGLELKTPGGRLRAGRVALATNAHRPLLGRLRWHIAPVYDYVLATEPLSASQMAALGWRNRQGLADVTNQFHYYRLTEDNRIIWGGYDAVYHYGRRVAPELDQRQETFEKLASHFFTTFPQLDGLGFTHKWGGAIDTCTRFCAFFGQAFSGRVAYAMGYTGLGVGASRFAAQVLVDLLSGERSELTELRMVRQRPLPFPPEPFAYLGIALTRQSLAAADRNEGRRNGWLRLLDRLGVGFDS